MSTIWSSSGDSAGESVRRRHDRAESALAEARADLARLEKSLEDQRDELQRLRQSLTDLDLERTKREEDLRRLERLLADGERRAGMERARISRLEHDAEQSLEARFRGRSRHP